MPSTRFTRLNDHNGAQDIVSPPPQYFSPDPNQSPTNYNNSTFYSQNGESDYMNRGIHKVSQFSISSQHNPTVGGSYDPLFHNEDTDKLLRKKRKSGTSTFSRRTSSQFFQVVHSGVSKFAAPLFAAPWRHELTKKDSPDSLPSTVRRFSRHRQRRRILVNGLIQWLVPVTFCGCLAAVMWSYDQQPVITHRQKYTFNALILGFSLCLGFAVASGLKGYATLLRWRLLAGRYREIQDFELLMGCESQVKVLRLIWAAQTPGKWMPNGLQIMCCLYILIMLGLQVTIACLGLTQSVDTSDSIVGTVYGNVSVASLKDIVTVDYGDATNDDTSYAVQGGAANSYGIAAQHYSVIELDDESSSDPEVIYDDTVYTDAAQSHYFYFFIDQSADPSSALKMITSRRVTSTAKCWQYPITENKYADSTNNTITYTNTTDGDNYTFNTGDEWSYLSSTYYSNMNETCGPRCTETYIYNTGVDDSESTIPIASQFYYCQNTVSEVLNIDPDINATAVALPDRSARLLAGAIGYSGTFYTNSTLQTKNYPVDSLWSWNGDTDVSASFMTNAIMRFSIGALAAVDSDGPRRNTTGDTPIPAQTVSIIWPWAVAVLVIVPGVQLLVLIGTVIWANGAVIKDDSYLSAARLLRPIVDKLGNKGCALTGDEIAEALGNYKIIYGVRLPGQDGYDSKGGNEDGMMHLDIIAEEEGLGKSLEEGWRAGRHMPQGRYDGLVDSDDDSSTSDEKFGSLRGNEKRARGKRRMSL